MTPESLRSWLRATNALAGAGVFAPVRPDRLVRIAAAPLRLGPGLATLVAIAAARDPDRAAIVDERGVLGYGELERRSAAIAAGLRGSLGVAHGRAVALMARNHRGFVEAAVAASRCGADLLSVNTELPAPQLAHVVGRARPTAIVHDDEFAAALDEAGLRGNRVRAWHDDGTGGETLEALAARPPGRAPSSRRQGRIVLLTSGTTGVPKSAPRDPSGPALVAPATTLIGKTGLRAGEPLLIAPPLFHGYGFAALALGLFLGSTIVLRRRLGAEATLAAIAEQEVTALVAVPTMLRRIVQLPEAVRARHDSGSLRVVLTATAPLDGELSTSFTAAFGDVLYNAYGTTEVGIGTLATPADLRAAPGTVGRVAEGATVKILDERLAEVEPGVTGRVFIGGKLAIEGYDDGVDKETAGGLMSTGDLGHVDADGRVFIDGREDDMIVSGGENVFPQEVEDVLRSHPGVADVAVVGIPDAEFGQRLRAFVVARPGAGPSEGELEAHVRARLERYKVPREIVFADELPRTATGKVLRSRLAPADPD